MTAVADCFVFTFEIAPKQASRIFQRAYPLGGDCWLFAEVVDLPREDQARVKLRFVVDCESTIDAHISDTAKHEGSAHAGDDGFILAETVVIQPILKRDGFNCVGFSLTHLTPPRDIKLRLLSE